MSEKMKCAFVWHCHCFGRRRNEPQIPQLHPRTNLTNSEDDAERKAMTFSYRELATATNNFRDESVIGEGGFGAVYKGKLEKSDKIIAVKKLNHSGSQGEKEFLVEVVMLSRLRHPNLVTLIGYCAEGDQRLLVYEFMPLRSLESLLHGRKGSSSRAVDWNTRMTIAIGAAKGLNYLHNEADPPVIFRDLKSSNILLDEGCHPKLSDFGLAKFGHELQRSTRVMGTAGYCAPEYASTGNLTVKSDVYSFGIVLLELISGCRPVDMIQGNGKHMLVDWARPWLKEEPGRLVSLADPQMERNFSVRSLRKAVEVALKCVEDDPECRPNMNDVVESMVRVVDEGGQTREVSSSNQIVEEDEETSSLLRPRPVEEKEEQRADAVADAKMWAQAWRDKHKEE